MMENFFNLKIQRADGLGFEHFSAPHLLLILLCALGAGLMCRGYSKGGPLRRRGLRLALGWGAVGIELLRALLLILSGEYGVGRLPLHLCGMAVYALLLHALRGGFYTGQFLYAFCMPGAAAALLFPDWSYYPALSFMSLTSFALHGMIVAYVLMQAAGGDIEPKPCCLSACMGIMLLLALPVYFFDRLTNTNYMFLNWPAPNSPLEYFSFLGRPGYLLGFLPLIGAVWTLIYLPFVRRKK